MEHHSSKDISFLEGLVLSRICKTCLNNALIKFLREKRAVDWTNVKKFQQPAADVCSLDKRQKLQQHTAGVTLVGHASIKLQPRYTNPLYSCIHDLYCLSSSFWPLISFYGGISFQTVVRTLALVGITRFCYCVIMLQDNYYQILQKVSCQVGQSKGPVLVGHLRCVLGLEILFPSLDTGRYPLEVYALSKSFEAAQSDYCT